MVNFSITVENVERQKGQSINTVQFSSRAVTDADILNRLCIVYERVSNVVCCRNSFLCRAAGTIQFHFCSAPTSRKWHTDVGGEWKRSRVVPAARQR